MTNVISHTEVEYLLYDIAKRFPKSFHAGVICDKDGFILTAKIPKKNNDSLSENDLALLAISENKRKQKSNDFIEIKKDLDESKNIKLLLLLKKDKNGRSNHQQKELKRILTYQSLF